MEKDKKEVKEKATEEEKKEKVSLGRALDNGLLKYSTTKLGLTDYDKDKDYSAEERKFTLKDFGIMLGIMVGIIAVAAILVCFVLT